jgi:hypothetical protein
MSEKVTIKGTEYEIPEGKDMILGEAARENPFAILAALDENSGKVTYLDKLQIDAAEEADGHRKNLEILEGQIRLSLKEKLGIKPTVGDIDAGFNAYYLAYAIEMKEVIPDKNKSPILVGNDVNFVDTGLLMEYCGYYKKAKEAEKTEIKLKSVSSEQKNRLTALKKICDLMGHLIQSGLITANATKVLNFQGQTGFKDRDAF